MAHIDVAAEVVIEAVLEYVVQNKVAAASARLDLFERRRRLMEDSAAYLDAERGQEVLPAGDRTS